MFYFFKGEEEEKEKKPDVGFGRIIRYNAPEWPFILVGCIAACLNGGVQPAFAVIFAELIGVSIVIILFTINYNMMMFLHSIFLSVVFSAKDLGTSKALLNHKL